MTTEDAQIAPAPLGQVERGVGRLVPERKECDAPLCIWCEKRAPSACKSRYDTLTCERRVIVPTPEEWAWAESSARGEA